MDALNIRVINNHNQVIGTPDDPPGTPTVIGLLKETYNRLYTATENTNLDITNLQDRVTTLENTVDGSDTSDPSIQGLSTRVEELENTVIEQTLSIQNITDDISENRTNIARNGATILTLQNRLNDTNTEIGRVERSLTRDISTVSDRVTQIDDSETGRLSVLETTVSNLVDEVEGQDGALEDITNLQADVSILDTNVGTLQTDVGTLQTGVGTLQTNVGTLQTDVATLEQTINNLPPGGVGQSTNQTGGERFNLYESRNTASGDYSHAEGYMTQATGNYSHVEGSSNLAQGESSHVEGYDNKAIATGSHAEGRYCEANGIHSHAGGTRSKSAGSSSFAHGYNCQANGDYSFAIGESTIASGSQSFAGGYSSTAAGIYSCAYGFGTYADSKALTVVGRFNTSTTGITNQDRRLFVVGNGYSNSVLNKSDAFVVNYDGSVIINSTRSETNPSLIIGNNNSAAGKSSLAQGEEISAFGNYSFATGLGTMASSKCQTAIGKYNTTDPLGQDIISRLFVVGNGNNDNDRSDAFTVYNSGEFGHNNVKMFMGDITLNVYYASSNHDITTFGVAYMTSNYKYCYISNVTIYVKFQGTFNINSIVVNGKTFKALDPSKNRGGGFATACADYQLNSLIYNCTLTHSGNTYYYLKYWQSYISPNSNFADRYWNISLYNCIFQDPTQYES